MGKIDRKRFLERGEGSRMNALQLDNLGCLVFAYDFDLFGSVSDGVYEVEGTIKNDADFNVDDVLISLFDANIRSIEVPSDNAFHRVQLRYDSNKLESSCSVDGQPLDEKVYG